MKKNLLLILFGIFFLSGCVNNPTPAAFSFVSHSGMGTHPVNEEVRPLKVGESACHQIFMILSVGDCTIDKAMRVGGIKRIHSVEHDSAQVIYIYGKYVTRVLGE